jgi:hypothetical protein
MSLTLPVALRLALAAALLTVPSAGLAEAENPHSLGTPNMSDNPYLDPNFLGGGDAGSPWPVSIRDGRRPGSSTQSLPDSSAAAGPWPGPVVTLLPGSLPGLLWIPLPGGPASPAPS